MNNEIVAEIKDRLRKAIDESGMKPIDLAEKTKIPKSSISQYLSGTAKPKGDRIYTLSRALGVDEAWLLGYDVPKKEKKIVYVKDFSDKFSTDDDMSNSDKQYNDDRLGYYLDDEAQDAAQFLFENPDYKVLFDATRKVKPEDIDFVKQMINKMYDK